ncbi:MAG: hypothetical protein PHG80_11285 [Methanoregulaceae archaeon]|nr:hypothetical protein [Methanoregulaceae archaeon]
MTEEELEERILRVNEYELEEIQEAVASHWMGECGDDLSAKLFYDDGDVCENRPFTDLEPAPPKDWLPVCASAIDVADTCKNCPYRAQCKKLSDEMDEACGIAKERENDG